MCLSIPAKIISLEGDTAQVSVGGTTYETSLQLVEDIKIGDYVLVHTGFAIQKISKEEAEKTMQLLNDLEDIEKEIDKTDKKDFPKE